MAQRFSHTAGWDDAHLIDAALAVRTDEGKPYLCAIKDVYSNRIVG